MRAGWCGCVACWAGCFGGMELGVLMVDISGAKRVGGVVLGLVCWCWYVG